VGGGAGAAALVSATLGSGIAILAPQGLKIHDQTVGKIFEFLDASQTATTFRETATTYFEASFYW